MSTYRISASNSMGAFALQTPYELKEALRKIVELRAEGFQHIRLTVVETGIEIKDIERFLRDSGEF